MNAKILQTWSLVILLLLGSHAQALILSPGGEFTNEIFYPAYSNPDAADISAITGMTVDELYRDNVGGVEEGLPNFMASYDTIYWNTETDPSEAIIKYEGGDIMSYASWLLVKDGSASPSWYLFDISFWDGIEQIRLNQFWPQQGAISHISIFGANLPNEEPSGSTPVPEPGTLALLGLGLAGLGFSHRKKV